jgi:hypothetical protein
MATQHIKTFQTSCMTVTKKQRWKRFQNSYTKYDLLLALSNLLVLPSLSVILSPTVSQLSELAAIFVHNTTD